MACVSHGRPAAALNLRWVGLHQARGRTKPQASRTHNHGRSCRPSAGSPSAAEGDDSRLPPHAPFPHCSLYSADGKELGEARLPSSLDVGSCEELRAFEGWLVQGDGPCDPAAIPGHGFSSTDAGQGASAAAVDATPMVATPLPAAAAGAAAAAPRQAAPVVRGVTRPGAAPRVLQLPAKRPQQAPVATTSMGIARSGARLTPM